MLTEIEKLDGKIDLSNERVAVMVRFARFIGQFEGKQSFEFKVESGTASKFCDAVASEVGLYPVSCRRWPSGTRVRFEYEYVFVEECEQIQKEIQAVADRYPA